MSLLRLSHRESWWKDAEILMLRHQLAVAQRQRPRVHARLTWPDRVPLKYSIAWLICAVTCGREAVIVGWPSAVVRLAMTGKHRDGDCFRISRYGFFVAEARSIEELRRYVDLAEPEEALTVARHGAFVRGGDGLAVTTDDGRKLEAG